MSNKILFGLISATLLSSAFTATVFTHQEGDFIVRAGAVMVAPNESNQDIVTPDLGNLGEFHVDGDTQLGLNFTHMFTDNIGVELLAATPFSNDISIAGQGKGAETKQLPPR